MTERHSYDQIVELGATLRSHALRVITKRGLPHWERVTAATELLAETLVLPRDAQVLLLGCRQGALGVAIARDVPDGTITLVDTSVVALAMAERTLAANGITNAQIIWDSTLLPSAVTFDIVALELPVGRKLMRRWLLEAFAALRPGGVLYLAGPNDEGIQPAIDDARALFGNATLLTYRARNRVARATKETEIPLPPWANENGIAPDTWHGWTAIVGGHHLRLHSLPGIFGYDKLDEGTLLLLDSIAAMPRGARVLDIGCGYGLIGLVAAQTDAASVDMVDVNLLAVAAARENIRINDIQRAEALPSDGVAAVRDRRYDLILTNPPFHAGKSVEPDIAHNFMHTSRDLLVPGGQLVLVANAFLPYEQELRRRFKSVRTLAKTRRFQVLAAQ